VDDSEVTINYLAYAKQIEIKMAQGAKPGKEGSCPDRKSMKISRRSGSRLPVWVDLAAAASRHLFHRGSGAVDPRFEVRESRSGDSREARIRCRRGHDPAGVAKARADAVLIAGDSGGTGAAIKTSIKSGGAPWSSGLAEDATSSG